MNVNPNISDGLSVARVVHLLSSTGLVFTFMMGFAGLLGPFLVLIPFAIFYIFKRECSYFAAWRLSKVIALIIFNYILIIGIAFLVLGYIMYFAQNAVALTFIASFTLWNILFSTWNAIESVTALSPTSLKTKIYSTAGSSLFLWINLILYYRTS